MENLKKSKIKIALFAGGRGVSTIAQALAAHPQIQLTLLVNAYDDGLSTGRLREYIPGMLGPSDIRKNFSHLISTYSAQGQGLKFLLEYRFPEFIQLDFVIDTLRNLSNTAYDKIETELGRCYENLSLSCARTLSHFIKTFLKYHETRLLENTHFNFSDCSLGNIIFAGCYLETQKDFNKTISKFCSLYDIPAKIINVTDGKNLVLTAIKEDGEILKRESEIVDQQSVNRIAGIFLLSKYLEVEELSALQKCTVQNRIKNLRQRSIHPEMNSDAKVALQEAQMIIYGPGTQHSSLFPSYLTQSLGEQISLNKNAEKIFVSNTRIDHEIQSETVDSLIEKLIFYLSEGSEKQLISNQVVTRCFLQSESAGSEPGATVPKYSRRAFGDDVKMLSVNWETSVGVHLGGKVAEEIISIANERAQEEFRPLPYMVSIIVPALNEARTVTKVLTDLRLLDMAPMGIAKEIIFVDGGSTDGTYALAEKVRSIRTFHLDACRGRGHALRFGVEQARGNLIVFFSSDGEYNPQDLFAVISILLRNEFRTVFGSRAIKCESLPKRIREIYGNDYLGYLLGYYGGKFLSILSMLLYSRFISDPLTGIKAFQKRLLTSLQLTSDSMDLDMEIIAKLSQRSEFILEVPVDYYPRKSNQGKKNTAMGGIMALLALIRHWRRKSHENTLDYHSGFQRKENLGRIVEKDIERAA